MNKINWPDVFFTILAIAVAILFWVGIFYAGIKGLAR